MCGFFWFHRVVVRSHGQLDHVCEFFGYAPRIVASVPGEDDSPVRLNFSDSSFSVTYIQALTASWLTEPKPTQWSPFPKEQPKFPILQSFHADQPDYKEYCNPEILQDPSSFQGASIDETNPCYHTFNAKIADLDPESNPPLPKGVTEQAGAVGRVPVVFKQLRLRLNSSYLLNWARNLIVDVFSGKTTSQFAGNLFDSSTFRFLHKVPAFIVG